MISPDEPRTDQKPTSSSPHYRCTHEDCLVEIYDQDEALDHVTDHPSHILYILVICPQIGDHIYVNRLESPKTPWLIQHHGIVVPGSTSDTLRVCHFETCGEHNACIQLTTILAFTKGLSMYLSPQQRIRVNPISFALACVGKTGFDAQVFNCEHFVNLCITGKSASSMSSNALILFTGLGGSLVTLLGGWIGAGLWMAGKTALVGKLMLDNMAEEGIVHHGDICFVCGERGDVVTLPKCYHNACMPCVSSVGKNVVCPLSTCFETFFQFSVNNL